MWGFIEGEDRSQATLFPELLDDYVAEDNPVRVIDVFIDDLDISGLGFKSEPAATGKPGMLHGPNYGIRSIGPRRKPLSCGGLSSGPDGYRYLPHNLRR